MRRLIFYKQAIALDPLEGLLSFGAGLRALFCGPIRGSPGRAAKGPRIEPAESPLCTSHAARSSWRKDARKRPAQRWRRKPASRERCPGETLAYHLLGRHADSERRPEESDCHASERLPPTKSQRPTPTAEKPLKRFAGWTAPFDNATQARPS